VERFDLTSGRDSFVGSVASVEVNGGGGRDTLTGGTGADRLDGGEDHDILIGGLGADTLIGGNGIDRVHYTGATEGLSINLFNGARSGAAAGDVFEGIEIWALTDHADSFFATAGAEQIEGGAGDDYVAGRGGNDALIGGDGHDTLHGEGGNDVLIGDRGNDLLYGEEGDDIFSGDDGNDLIAGGAGNDDGAGGEGNDSLYGMGDNDRLHGGAGDDFVDGDFGNDTLYGGAGDDYLDPGEGSDIVYAGPNNGDGLGDYIWSYDSDNAPDTFVFLGTGRPTPRAQRSSGSRMIPTSSTCRCSPRARPCSSRSPRHLQHARAGRHQRQRSRHGRNGLRGGAPGCPQSRRRLARDGAEPERGRSIERHGYAFSAHAAVRRTAGRRTVAERLRPAPLISLGVRQDRA
jgi:hypothetical protein